jgi:hypothetical protein
MHFQQTCFSNQFEFSELHIEIIAMEIHEQLTASKGGHTKFE